MPTEVNVPSVGESVSEIYIGKWYKAEGDTIKTDEPLVELESDKATLDVPAPLGGVLVKILKQTGETAEVGETIAQIEPGVDPLQRSTSPAENVPTKRTPEPAAPAAEAAPPKKPAPKPAPAERAPTPPPKPQKAEEPPTITESAPIVDRTPTVEPQEEWQRDAAERASAAAPTTAVERGEEAVPLSPVRRRIAARLVEAQHNAALLTTFNEIDMTAVKDLRSQLGEAFQKRHGVKLGFMSFFVKAAIDALRQCPELNGTIENDHIVYRRYYDIGVAIGSDRGLVVPILRNAERMSFAEVERTIEELAKRAQTGNLRVEELQGGTFTISNGGVYGSLLSTPIVNPPQSGVLGMHAIQNRPVAINNQVVIRPMMYVALTYDHRIVDGREAVTFLRRIKEAVEAPSRLLLEV
jgi:2-oxoglutarate dehydrogenase E2 component (dihydrolipoamide succinyltransferase)